VTRPDFDSYLICATPRSGSTLLCGLLESSGVAGHPASYFNREGLNGYADDWRIARPRDGQIDEAFVRAALTAGKTSNGVFGGRIMAETLPELISGLAAAASRPAVTDVDLLSAQLGRLRFVHLRRRDVVAQAVSWAKSLQTHFWHPGEAVAAGGQDPHYDEELIGRLVATIERSEADWTVWFAAHSIVPCEVTKSWRQIRPALHKRCSTISVLMFRRIGNWWSGTVDRPINSTRTGLRDLSLTEPSVLPERLPASRRSCGRWAVP
jgi:trehalose 2-sulfotransferase